MTSEGQDAVGRLAVPTPSPLPSPSTETSVLLTPPSTSPSRSPDDVSPQRNFHTLTSGATSRDPLAQPSWAEPVHDSHAQNDAYDHDGAGPAESSVKARGSVGARRGRRARPAKGEADTRLAGESALTREDEDDALLADETQRLASSSAADPAYASDDGGSSDVDIMPVSPSSRPPMHRPTGGRSEVPLLKDERGRPSYDSPHGSARPPLSARHSTFRSRSPDLEAASATRKKYVYAGFFLIICLISFVVQTETAAYIQIELGWNKAYCMLYLTHGSWIFLWPATLLILRFQKRNVAWKTFWRRHVYILRTTAQMVQSQDLHLERRESMRSPIPYMLRTIATITSALTIAGGSWYLAVDWTTPSDLTAIYNCSAFFAYAFSIPLLGDKLRFDKAFAVVVAIAGVLVVAYGDSGTNSADGQKPSGSPTGGEQHDGSKRALGNIIIGIGSVLYGLYEVLYKKLACPPEGTSAGRGMIFAMTVGSMIGAFTLSVLWIPLPILHFMGWETFELPRGQAAWLLMISTLSNATFSGAFLVLISLTSPVLSSVAALLTIFLVALTDWMLPNGQPLSLAALIGGLLIIGAFLLLSWSTYREMNEERRKHLEEESILSDCDDD